MEMVNVEELFASKVFTLGKMKERLPKGTFKEVNKIINEGGELSKEAADVWEAAHRTESARTEQGRDEHSKNVCQ